MCGSLVCVPEQVGHQRHHGGGVIDEAGRGNAAGEMRPDGTIEGDFGALLDLHR